jgi:hypothetical protein
VSGFRAISGVSATLRNLLRDRMEQPATITIAPPDVTVQGAGGRRVTLSLFPVTENGFLRNQEIPGRGHPAAYGHPPLSLVLHYLMTTFGAQDTAPDGDLEAQQILGDAMRVFHDVPIVTDSLHENNNPADPLILDAALLGEFERVKITLKPATLDDYSKIWSALPQSNFRRSVSYEASVVQIESRRRRRSALPVRERRVHVVPLETPFIARILRDPPFAGVDQAVAETGDTVVIEGRRLSGASTTARISGTPVTPATQEESRLSFVIPATVRAGLHTVQVVRDLLFETTPGTLVPHQGFESNVAPLMVIPRLVSLLPAGGGAGATLTATVQPPVLATQRKSLLFGDFELPAQPVLPDAPPSTTVAFVLPTGVAAIPAGTYFVRVRVDGAESRLTSNPATGEYTGPTYGIT